MEAQVIFPKWQAKFERSFPAEIISVVSDAPKSETSGTNSKNEGINPWIVVGVVAVVGITLYFIWKQDQDAKMRRQDTDAPPNNSFSGDHNPYIQN